MRVVTWSLVASLVAAPCAAGPVEKRDLPQSVLLVPLFEVDTSDPFGDTTLFGIRNVTEEPISATVEYFDRKSNLVRTDMIEIAARAVSTVNVRDVGGLDDLVEEDDYARGFVRVTTETAGALVGDYFNVDLGNDFASGERMVGLDDLCKVVDTRFLDFGSGSKLVIFVEQPQGDDPGSDPPTAILTLRDEDGFVRTTLILRTDDNVLIFDLAALLPPEVPPFGSAQIDFELTRGWAFSAYSADGRFSVGLNAACLEPAVLE